VALGYARGETIAPPPKLQELLDAADLIASAIPIFVRLDFYMTARGPVLGEVSFPSSKGFTEFGADMVCDLWNRHPDAPIKLDWHPPASLREHAA
jgi:hypothetical protein